MAITFTASFAIWIILTVCAIMAFYIILNDIVSRHHILGAMTWYEQYQQDPIQQQLVSNQIDFFEQNVSHNICCKQFGEGR
jgi:hypothetical protein